MKAVLENVTGVTIKRDIDVSDTPMSIIRKFYEDDATAASQIFADQKAINQLMSGHIDESRSSFELISTEADNIRADWKTALCNQPSIKEEMARIESEGQVPTFVVSVSSLVAALEESDEHTPRLTCMVLQSILGDDDVPYAFSTRDRNYEGVFEIFSANAMKIVVEKSGDAILLWESQKLINKKLRHILEERIKANDLDFDGEYDVSIEGDCPYTIKVEKKLEHGSDSIQFACDVACEQVLFLIDVNGLVNSIKDTLHSVSSVK